MDRDVKEVLKACEAMIKEGSSTFYKAFGFLQSPRREAVFVIYAFCRLIDDATDEPERSCYTPEELAERFDQLETAEGHFIWPALRWLFTSFPVSKAPFWKQMEGQRLDSHLTHYESMEQLERYCYLVAGTVGEMLLPVLHGHPDRYVAESGIWLGKAMQIVNIVRDVGEDRDRGRRYIPLELLAKHNYTLQDFQSGVMNSSWTSLIEELCLLAGDWFEKGLCNLEAYPRQSAFCVELAARMYGAILEDAARHHYDVFTRRAHVPAWRKMTLLQQLLKKHGMPLPKEREESTAVS
ncbi:phytoene/squalene synthase family protein [Paenibacillus abyssi]|uniref:Dehydrosqualene synthase n=1 Tax=Paenibacillus abyssi TaxID=1340531 RepID=A0A917LGC3_9BACL|nr:phytoene/squalene synthase family protein [Paenibacillus abyssi]GGG20753.1 dehydrosqualene synthase [Paenibacillus abyssi]